MGRKVVNVFLALVLGVFLIVGCNNAVEQSEDQKETPVGSPLKELSEKKTALIIVQLLRGKNFEELNKYVHPDKGVRFSPYASVNVERDLVFKELSNLMIDDTVREWGYYDGSGEPIQLTFRDYYVKFIYDREFAEAREIGYNETIGVSTTHNNAVDVYPGSFIVEFHIAGTDSDGMDWASLRIVLEKWNNEWKLVGIIHDQWTI